MNTEVENPTYIVLGCKPWNKKIFDSTISKYPGTWHYIENQAELSLNNIKRMSPRYLFFLHWSWKVPDGILDDYDCVCFHMTDVPYGRGGSPLQNLIIRGHRKTKLTALRMVSDFDAGPVYLKKDLPLYGNAEEIYIRATVLAAEMIEYIVEHSPEPVPQSGAPVEFKRRKPAESLIPEFSSLSDLYDFIRMLDAQGYPRAFIDHFGFRYLFSRTSIYDGKIIADVEIIPIEDGEP